MYRQPITDPNSRSEFEFFSSEKSTKITMHCMVAKGFLRLRKIQFKILQRIKILPVVKMAKYLQIVIKYTNKFVSIYAKVYVRLTKCQVPWHLL